MTFAPVSALIEIEVEKIDQLAIVKRFDGIETNNDRLDEFLSERFSADGSGSRRGENVASPRP